MHGQLETQGGYIIMAADSTAPDAEVVRGGMNLCLWGTDEDSRLAGPFNTGRHAEYR